MAVSVWSDDPVLRQNPPYFLDQLREFQSSFSFGKFYLIQSLMGNRQSVKLDWTGVFGHLGSQAILSMW